MIAPAAGAPLPADTIATATGISRRELEGNVVRLADPRGTEFALELDPHAYPGSYAIVASALGRNKSKCTVEGWIVAKQVPAALPIPAAALRTMSFLYRKDLNIGPDQAQWHCGQFARENTAQCLAGTHPAIAHR